jgi:hypothetical protein
MEGPGLGPRTPSNKLKKKLNENAIINKIELFEIPNTRLKT